MEIVTSDEELKIKLSDVDVTEQALSEIRFELDAQANAPVILTAFPPAVMVDDVAMSVMYDADPMNTIESCKVADNRLEARVNDI